MTHIQKKTGVLALPSVRFKNQAVQIYHTPPVTVDTQQSLQPILLQHKRLDELNNMDPFLFSSMLLPEYM
jgi:hypothetical protein